MKGRYPFLVAIFAFYTAPHSISNVGTDPPEMTITALETQKISLFVISGRMIYLRDIDIGDVVSNGAVLVQISFDFMLDGRDFCSNTSITDRQPLFDRGELLSSLFQYIREGRNDLFRWFWQSVDD